MACTPIEEHAHVATLDEDASPWVFISHTTADADIANRLCRVLEGSGTRCWIAPRDIGPGDTWMGAVYDAAERTPNMVVLLSPAALASKNIESEVTIAFQADVRIIPVFLRPVQLPNSLRYSLLQQHMLDATGMKEAEWMRRVAEQVKARDTTVSRHAARQLTPGSSAANPVGTRPGRFKRLEIYSWISGGLIVGGLTAAALLSGSGPGVGASDKLGAPEGNATPTAEGTPMPPSTDDALSRQIDLLLESGDRHAALRVLDEAVGASNHAPSLVELRESLCRTNSLGMRLVRIPAASFLMGSPADEVDRNADEAQVTATLERDFFIADAEVTRAQFRAFVDATGYRTTAETDGGGHYYSEGRWRADPDLTWRAVGFDQTDDHPVVEVSWSDASAFCQWLSDVEHQRYRLPDEVEWELACRAGSTTPFPWGVEVADAPMYANLGSLHTNDADSTYPELDDGFENTAPVRAFLPNRWGLYDMIGNVGEWCANPYDSYPIDATAGRFDGDATYRAYRGGAWLNGGDRGRSAHRFKVTRDRRFSGLGFRVVLEIE